MQIKLVENGIFPILYGINDGISYEVDHKLGIPGTIQGEGKLIGTSCLFIRLSGCNLRCIFELWDGSISPCDTAYSSHDTTKYEMWDIEDIISVVYKNIGQLKHIVISGGEPTIQKDALIELVEQLKLNFSDVHITLETNGTVFIKEVAKYVDLYSISPKLVDSVPTESKLYRLNITTSKEFETHDSIRHCHTEIQKYIDMCYSRTLFGKKRNKHNFQLKFVVSNTSSEIEIDEILKNLKGVELTDIYVMPAGGNTRLLKKTIPVALEMAIRNGWQFTPRMHIELFGNKKGV